MNQPMGEEQFVVMQDQNVVGRVRLLAKMRWALG
jgi:hypothetical protein